MMAEAMTDAGLRIDRRLPRGAVPRGEPENVHRGGGRYVSIIGNNDLFHNTIDRGVDAVDLNVIERFARTFARVATSLASAEAAYSIAICCFSRKCCTLPSALRGSSSRKT